MFNRLYFILLALLPIQLFAQQDSPTETPIGGQTNDSRPITTAVPFLAIAPDARSSGMGDVGAATSPDATATHWNPAKLAFAERDMAVSLSYSPWLQRIVGDMSLSYLTGYKKLSKTSAIAASMRYFDLGSMQFTDANKQIIQDFNPREFAFDASYAMKLSKKFSMAVSGRYIYSNLSGNITNSSTNTDTRAANSVAVDISAFYTTDFMMGGLDSDLAFGANISNMGPKISYSSENQKDFIPTNLRLGTALTSELDPYNKLTFALDFNKLLVPSPAEYDEDGNLINGSDASDTGWVTGMFQSFGDAPGGASEELQEFMIGTGLEYWYNDLVAARAGYYYESENKGDRQYFTVGVGLRYQVFGIDFSYLITTAQNHPLQDTLRFTLFLNFNDKATASNTGSVN
ncbi:type IX secretion system outer membrane channel protein PorV [Flammeovirgaceae bacterium SG7u.111]|nr:type IX secretion system outer membrane channel protein PorV [Flammeovirgaceae bacterium SG7u.132]WPO36115.1 type IX secretion system outer membrane channel protein PorV [Flammeovirgaceae bacterium SG7u.111]